MTSRMTKILPDLKQSHGPEFSDTPKFRRDGELPDQIQIHGPALRSQRLAADLTLERLASDAGVSEFRLQAMEAGDWVAVEADIARGLIEALDCDFEELFKVVERVANGE